MEKVSKTLLHLRRLETRLEGLETRLERIEGGVGRVALEIGDLRQDMNARFATTNDYLRDVRDLLKMGLLDKRRVDDLDRRVTALETRRPRRRAS